MRKLILRSLGVHMLLGVAALALASPSNATWWRITEIIDATGDGGGNTLVYPAEVAVDSSGNVYVAGSFLSDSVFKITPSGTITEIIDATGDGIGNTLDEGRGVAVDSSGSVYVTGYYSDNAFKIQPVQVPALSNGGLAVLAMSLLCAASWLSRRQRLAKR